MIVKVENGVGRVVENRDDCARVPELCDDDMRKRAESLQERHASRGLVKIRQFRELIVFRNEVSKSKT